MSGQSQTGEAGATGVLADNEAIIIPLSIVNLEPGEWDIWLFTILNGGETARRVLGMYQNGIGEPAPLTFRYDISRPRISTQNSLKVLVDPVTFSVSLLKVSPLNGEYVEAEKPMGSPNSPTTDWFAIMAEEVVDSLPARVAAGQSESTRRYSPTDCYADQQAQ